MGRFVLTLLMLGGCRPTPGGETAAPVAAPLSTAPPRADPPTMPPTPARPVFPRDGFADIASEPVHVWVGRAPDGVLERLVIIGHADMLCCDMISGLVGASLVFNAIAGDYYHGFGDVRARDNPEGLIAIQAILGVIEQARNSEAECARQIYVHSFDTTEREAAAAQLHADAERGSELAIAAGRPLMVWNDNLEAVPQFAPALTMKGGKVAPLQLELAYDEFHLPRDLAINPSLLRDEIRDSRTAVARFRNVAAIVAELRALIASGSDYVIRQDYVRARSSAVAALKADLLAYNACLEHVRELWRRLQRLNEDFNRKDDESERAILELAEFIDGNERQLRLIANPGDDPRAQINLTRCERTTVAHNARLRRQIRHLDVAPIVRKLEEEAEHWRKLAADFNASEVGGMIDSGLRGINLGFSEKRYDDLFDRWMVRYQGELWRKLRAEAQRQGLRLGTSDDPAGVLNASNLVLRVERIGDRVRITPHFVLTGPFYQVIDPISGLIYYESAIAEHHLARGEE